MGNCDANDIKKRATSGNAIPIAGGLAKMVQDVVLQLTLRNEPPSQGKKESKKANKPVNQAL
jgi:hypothetical protein